MINLTSHQRNRLRDLAFKPEELNAYIAYLQATNPGAFQSDNSERQRVFVDIPVTRIPYAFAIRPLTESSYLLAGNGAHN